MTMTIQLDIDGAVVLRSVVPPEAVEALAPAFDGRRTDRAGLRSFGDAGVLRAMIGGGALGRLAGELMGKPARPVRVVLFDKTPDANWGVPWHQDRTIAVVGRTNDPTFRNWNTKDGVTHVEPPTDILAGMLTLRLFVDDCDVDQGPVEVARGTHRLGRVPAGDAASIARGAPNLVATGRAGDVLAMRLLALHASKPARVPSTRRVLHVDYADPAALPPALAWALDVEAAVGSA